MGDRRCPVNRALFDVLRLCICAGDAKATVRPA